MIWEAHYSRVAGHFGIGKTTSILQKHFYWPKMKQDIISYIQACAACAIAKPANRKLGLYLPLPIPNKPWHLFQWILCQNFQLPGGDMIVYMLW